MEYNDNFVLPPNDILEKMRVDYQKVSLKSSVLNTDSLNINVSSYAQEAIKALTYSYYFLSDIINNIPNFMVKQKLNPILVDMKNHIIELRKLYPSLDIINKEKPLLNNKRTGQLLKELIILEIDSIKSLMLLEQNENNLENKKIINNILEDIFSIIKDIINI